MSGISKTSKIFHFFASKEFQHFLLSYINCNHVEFQTLAYDFPIKNNHKKAKQLKIFPFLRFGFYALDLSGYTGKSPGESRGDWRPRTGYSTFC